MNHGLFRCRCWVLVAALMLGMATVDAACAAGLGNIKVFSYLNENLDAEVELLSEAPDVDNMLVSVASQEEFERAGVPRSAALNTLVFQIIRDEDEVFIHATSTDPIAEPYLDILLDLSWGSGRLIRRYTILLDPVPLEGKPAHARRRQLPNTVERPMTVGKTEPKQYSAPQVTEVAAEVTGGPSNPLVIKPEAGGVPLKAPETGAEKTSASSPSTTTEKLKSNVKAPATPSAHPSQEMSKLFEQEAHPGDLSSVVEDIRQLVVGAETAPAQAAPSVEPVATAAHVPAPAALMPAAPPPTAHPTVAPAPAKTAATPSSGEDLRSQLKPKHKEQGVATLEPTLAAPKRTSRWQDFIQLFVTLGLTVAIGIGVWVYRRRRLAAQVNVNASDEEDLGEKSPEDQPLDRAMQLMDEMKEDNIDEHVAIDLATDPDLDNPELDETSAVPTPQAAVEPKLDYAQLDAVLAEEPPAPEAPPPSSLVVEMPDLFDIRDEVPEPEPVAEEAHEEITIPELPPEPAQPAPPPPQEELTVEEIHIDVPEEIHIDVPDLSPPTGDAEVALKLQLAQQYLDMGDFTGAKDLLKYVLTAGNEAEKAEAQFLLEKIGSD